MDLSYCGCNKWKKEGEFGYYSTAEEVTENIDARGLVIIVTGGTSGIGVETVRVLSARGAHVIIGARDLERAAQVKKEILKIKRGALIDYVRLDLSSMSSVRQAANEFLALNLPLNVLVNNAGLVVRKFVLTGDGIEKIFATNYLGHFLFTQLMLEKMKVTAEESGIEGRIVNVSSKGHSLSYNGGIDFESIKQKNDFDSLKAYGQSKLAQILYSKELAKRLKAEGANVTVNALHPGAIATGLMRDFRGYRSWLPCLIISVVGRDIPQGAATQCYVAIHPAVKGISGEYFDNCKVSKSSHYGCDEELAKRLWDISIQLTGENL